MGDYLILHFGLYGILTAVGIRVLRPPRQPASTPSPGLWRLGIAVLATTAYGMLAIGLPTDRFVTSLAAGESRVPIILALLCGTLPYFLADEWLTRGATAARGGYAATKVCFLASLVFAITLNLPKLFFLAIIIPAILVLFLIYGLFSAWAYRRTNVPLVGALANALVFAWAIAVTFPLLDR
jgi:hypothetical protein